MMKAIILMMMMFTQMNVFKQAQETQWVLVNGGFDANAKTALFEKFDSTKHNQFVYETFQFHSDGTLSFKRLNPQKQGFCGVGLFQMKKGVWKGDKNGFNIEMDAGRLGMSDFSFSRHYRFEMKNDSLLLTLLHEAHFKENNPFNGSQDVIKF